ncbi:lipase chaperone (plasmid) [Pseudoalteromonas xiamenensis]|uniref:lipase secretion chaperone n=1 Tax=Pseudoalteromonas xiamenensis TaxID=882626 RepID=UPI0027E4F5C0|nr:lipase secretion chaperone [Pseudoalteromonas xiamenensis]WMN61885.1 lipase chaperone [Pseudoalteromonas xiamenensis]
MRSLVLIILGLIVGAVWLTISPIHTDLNRQVSNTLAQTLAVANVDVRLQTQEDAKGLIVSSTECNDVNIDRTFLENAFLAWQENPDTQAFSVCEEALLKRYISFKQALAQYAPLNLSLSERLAIYEELLRKHFTAEQFSAWFADEMRWNVGAKERAEILSDIRLSKEEKERWIAESIERLSEEEQKAIMPTLMLEKALQPDQTKHAVWLSEQTPEVQARILVLEKEKEQWQSRLNEWFHFLEDEPSVVDKQYYLETHFSLQERKRVMVITKQYLSESGHSS